MKDENYKQKNLGPIYAYPMGIWFTIFFIAPILIILAYSFLKKGLYGGVEMEFSLNLMGATKGGFLQFSGMTVTYDINAEPGSRVVSITVGDEELDPDATYKLAATDFMITGGDGNVYLQDYPNQIQSGVDSMLIDYISDVGTITGSMITGNRLVPAAP